MNPLRLLLFLIIGTMAMLAPITIQGIHYGINGKKRLAIAILLTIAGTIGTFLLFYIENGRFGGTSFYGAIFFVPAAFLLIGRHLNVCYDQLIDLCAPAECVMLAIMKVQCYMTDCCGGRLIRISGFEFVFPSQIAELASALIICMILLLLSWKDNNRGKLYPIYMVVYGVVRFILNIFRNTKINPLVLMPLGNFWSIVAVLIGIIWLYTINKKRKANDHHS